METIQANLVKDVRQRVAEVVVGQDTVVERLLIALFTGGLPKLDNGAALRG